MEPLRTAPRDRGGSVELYDEDKAPRLYDLREAAPPPTVCEAPVDVDGPGWACEALVRAPTAAPAAVDASHNMAHGGFDGWPPGSSLATPFRPLAKFEPEVGMSSRASMALRARRLLVVAAGAAVCGACAAGDRGEARFFDVQLPAPTVLVSLESELIGHPTDIDVDTAGRV